MSGKKNSGSQGIPSHRNPKPGDKKRIGLSVSPDTYQKIYAESVRHDLPIHKIMETMVDFWQRNYIIVEQLSLTSKNKII